MGPSGVNILQKQNVMKSQNNVFGKTLRKERATLNDFPSPKKCPEVALEVQIVPKEVLMMIPRPPETGYLEPGPPETVYLECLPTPLHWQWI